MSENVNLKVTPLEIQVGERLLQFITFEDLYNMCLKDKRFFESLVRAGDRLGTLLLRRKGVLAAACVRRLRKLLRDRKMVEYVRKCIEEGIPWPKSGVVRDLCHWNDCPD